MSKLEANTIDTVSGTTNLVIGSTNTSTVTVPNGKVTGQNYPLFGVRLSANQTGLADNVPTLIQFDTVDFDTNSGFNTSTYTYTVPTGMGGKYLISACVHFHHPGQINYNNTQIYKNGSKLRETQFNSKSGDYEDEDSQMIITVEDFSAGDTIQIYGNANSGDGTDTRVTGGNNENHSFWRAYRIGA
jgi:hypothetical protein